MQIKKTISINFILLIFLSLAGSFSQSDLIIDSIDPCGTQTQLIEDSDQVLHEFRETGKVNFSAGVKTRTNHFTVHSNLLPNLIQYTRYTSYLQEQHSARPSEKLFIDFQVIII